MSVFSSQLARLGFQKLRGKLPARKSAARIRFRRAVVEQLEERRLLTAAPLPDSLRDETYLTSPSFGAGGGGGSGGSSQGPNETVWISEVADAVEGGTGFFRVSRTNSVPAMSVYYEVLVSSSAIPGTDYLPLSGNLEFTPGQATLDIVVTTLEDFYPEETKTIIIQLVSTSRPEAVDPSSTHHTLSIEDDDHPSLPVVTVILTMDAYEGHSDGQIVFLRSGSNNQPLSFAYRISLSTGLVYGSDFVLASPNFDSTNYLGNATFGAGESTVSVGVIAIDDTGIEDYEYFDVKVEHVRNANYIADSIVRTVGIVDNDAPESIPEITQIQLLNDTGDSGSDKITSDQTLIGWLEGNLSDGSLFADFDHNGDFNPEAAIAITDLSSSILYDPVSQDSSLGNYFGPVTINYRTRWMSGDGTLLGTSDWRSFSYTVEQDALFGPMRLDSIQLKRDTEIPDDKITGNPIITGKVIGDFDGKVARVEFDRTGDEIPDDSLWVAESGEHFFYDPRLFDPWLANYVGPMEIWYRLVEEGDTEVFGEWELFEYYKSSVPVSAYTITDLSHRLETGGSSQHTSYMGLAFSGTVSDQNGNGGSATGSGSGNGGTDGDWSVPPLPSSLRIQVDHDGDSVIDGATFPYSDSNFDYQPADISTGAHTLRFRTAEWSRDHEAFSVGAWVSYSFVFMPAEPPAIESIWLRTDTGLSSSDGVTADPTIQGQLVVPLSNVMQATVEFDSDGDSEPDTSMHVDDQGRFSKTFVNLLAGFQSFQVRTNAYDPALGADVIGSWQEFTFTYEPWATPTTTIELLVDDGSSSTDRTSSFSTLTGVVSPLFGNGIVVAFDINGDGVEDGIAVPQSDGHFLFHPAGIAPGHISVRGRVHRNNPYTELVEIGDWVQFSFTLTEPVPGSISLDTLQLAIDTGANKTDRITTNPTLTGSVKGNLLLEGVELDLNGDVLPDATALLSSNRTFLFTPVHLSLGQHFVSVRPFGYDYGTARRVYGNWTTIDFTLVQTTAAAAEIEILKLLSDSGESHSDQVTENVAILGQIADEEGVSNVTVQVDTTGDGSVGTTVFTDSQGRFFYEHPHPVVGSNTTRFRTTKFDQASGQTIAGQWHAMSYVWEDQVDSAPRIASHQFGTVSQPGAMSLSGSLTFQHGVDRLGLEIDVSGDGVPDIVTFTDRFGQFSTMLSGLNQGMHSVGIRTTAASSNSEAVLVSSWEAYQFEYTQVEMQPALVTTMGLANDDGSNDSDRVTSDPSLQGTVDRSPFRGFMTIELDFNGDNRADSQSIVHSDRTWSHSPHQLSIGTHTVRARTRDFAPNGSSLVGNWVPFTFTLVAKDDLHLNATIQGLTLVNDTGLSNTDLSTSHPAVTGTVVGLEATDRVTIEFDNNRDGRVDGSIEHLAGSFEYLPQGLPRGWIELRARVRRAESTSAWTKIEFIHHPDPDGTEAQAMASALATLQSANQDGANGHASSVVGVITAWNNFRVAEDDQFDLGLSLAAQSREQAILDADETYEAEYASANAWFLAAMQAAVSAYQSALAGTSGDTTSFPFEFLQWSSPPARDRLIIPDDQTQPVPPGRTPDFSGPEFNFSSDRTYTNATAAAKNTMEFEVRTAQDYRRGTDRQATLDHDEQVWLAMQEYQVAIRSARESFRDSMIDGPSETLLNAKEAYDQALQVAWDAYASVAGELGGKLADFLRSAQETMQSEISAAYYNYDRSIFPVWQAWRDLVDTHPPAACDVARSALIKYQRTAFLEGKKLSKTVSRAQRDYQLATIEGNRDLRLATTDDYLLFLQRANNAAEAHDRAVASFDFHLKQLRILATVRLEQSMASAKQALDWKLADAKKTLNVHLAVSKAVASIALETARVHYELSEVSSRHSAIHAWHQLANSPWSNYQLSIAASALQYLQAMSGPALQRATVETHGLRDESIAESDATWRHARQTSEMIRLADWQRSEAKKSYWTNTASVQRLADVYSAVERKSLRNEVALVNQQRDLVGEVSRSEFAIDQAAASHFFLVSMTDARILDIGLNSCGSSSTHVNPVFTLPSSQRNQLKDGSKHSILPQKNFGWGHGGFYGFGWLGFWGYSGRIPSTDAAHIWRTMDSSFNNAHYRLQLSQIDNNEQWTTATRSLWNSYQRNIDSASHSRSNELAGDLKQYHIQTAGIDRNLAIDVNAADGVLQVEIAQAHVNRVHLSATADSVYSVSEGQLQGQQMVANAQALKDFKQTEASSFKNRMANWNAIVDSPWSNLQLLLASTIETWASATGNAELAFAQATTTATNQRIEANSTRRKNYLVGESTAKLTRTENLVAAKQQYVNKAAGAKYDYAVELAGMVLEQANRESEQAEADAEETRTLQNSQSLAGIALESTYQRSMASAWRLYRDSLSEAIVAHWIALDSAARRYSQGEISYEVYLSNIESSNETWDSNWQAAAGRMNLDARSAWNVLRTGRAALLGAYRAYSASATIFVSSLPTGTTPLFIGRRETAEKLLAAETRAANIEYAGHVGTAEVAHVSTIAALERDQQIQTALTEDEFERAMLLASAAKSRGEFIANAAKRENQISARGLYESALYLQHALRKQSNAATLGSHLATFQFQSSLADSVWANNQRLARDIYEDTLSVVGLKQLDAAKSAASKKAAATNLASIDYVQTVAQLVEDKAIGLSKADAVMYISNTIAEAMHAEKQVWAKASYDHAAVMALANLNLALQDMATGYSQEIENLWGQYYLDSTSDWLPFLGSFSNTSAGGSFSFNFLSGYYSSGNIWGDNGGYRWNGWGSGYQWGIDSGWGGLFQGSSQWTTLESGLTSVTYSSTNAANAEELVYVEEIGNAWIERAIYLGDAQIQLASSRGAAAVKYVIAVNSVESTFTSAALTAKQDFETSSAKINKAHHEALAEADRFYVLDAQKPSLRFGENSSAASVILATAVASAEAVYQTSVANDQAMAARTLANWNGNPSLNYEAVHAEARADWVIATSQAYVQQAMDRATADGRHAISMVMARVARNIARAEANEEFQWTVGLADRDRSIGSASIAVAKDLAILDLVNARRLNNAENNAQWEQATAKNEKALAIGMATVEKELHLDRLSQVEEQERDRRKEQAIADLVWQQTTFDATARKSWSDAEAVHRRLYSIQQAYAFRIHLESSAQLDREHRMVIANATNQRDQTMARADGQFLIDQTLAGNNRRSQMAVAEIHLWNIEESQRVAAHQAIDLALNLPWSDYLVVAAVTRRDWWSQASIVYLGLASDRNALDMVYANRLAIASVQRSHTISSAIATSDISSSNRQLSAASERASADVNYTNHLANAARSYSRAINLAVYVHDIAVAEAEKDFAYHQDVNLSNQQIANAGNLLQQDIQIAENGWNGDDGIAQSNKFRELARIDRENLLLSITADVNLAISKENSEYLFRQQETSAYLQSALGWASTDAAYRQYGANSFSSAALAMAAIHPSPWARYEAAEYVAEASKIATISNVAVHKLVSQATAQATNESHQAQLSAIRAIAVAQLSGQHRTTLAQADYDLADAMANALKAASRNGIYNATQPEQGSPRDVSSVYDVDVSSSPWFNLSITQIDYTSTYGNWDASWGAWGHFLDGYWWSLSPWLASNWLNSVNDVILIQPVEQIGAEFWNVKGEADRLAGGNADYNYGIQRETDISMQGWIPQDLSRSIELTPVTASRLPFVPQPPLAIEDVASRLEMNDPALAEFIRSRGTLDNHVESLDRPAQVATSDGSVISNESEANGPRTAGTPAVDSPESEGRFFIRLPAEWNVETAVTAIRETARGNSDEPIPHGQRIRERFQQHIDNRVAGFDRRWIDLSVGVNVQILGDKIRLKNNGNDVYWSSSKRESYFGGETGISDVDIKIGVMAENGWVRLLSGKRATLESLQKWAATFQAASTDTINEVLDALISPYFVDSNSNQLGIFIGGTNMHFYGVGNVERLYNVYEGTKFYYGGVANPIDFDRKNYINLDGAAGMGWSAVLDRAMADISVFHRPGQRIHIFGWSRGAAMANDLAGRLAEVGIPVDFIGMFDPVYSNTFPGQDSLMVDKTFRGWAGNFVTADVPANVSAVAALYAINEDRSFFPATKFRTQGHTRLLTMASPGAHGEVGGHFTSNMGIQQLNLRAMIEFARGHSHATFRFRGIEEDVARIISSPLTLQIALSDVDEDKKPRALGQWLDATEFEQWSPYSNDEYFGFLNSDLAEWRPGGFGFQKAQRGLGLVAGLAYRFSFPWLILTWRPPQPLSDHYPRQLWFMGVDRELWDFPMTDDNGQSLELSNSIIRRIRSLYARTIDSERGGWLVP